MRENEGLYIISVAARLLEMHQQTLRKYERAGFIRPQRTGGNLRLYSVEDVERLRQIKYLVDVLGMNLDGVETMLTLTGRLRRLYRSLAPDLSPDEVDQARAEVAHMLAMLGVEQETVVEPPAAAAGERRGH
ncbi:MAG: MerR family transcriptional regulator [Chloroflexi bacterium]|nr:MerR family transcriptional regulator [Chloroflexota bacterium]